MRLKDYYKILGVDRGASANEIKDAYRKLIKVHHPDTNSNSQRNQKKFQDIIEAYKVLGNLDSRLQYSIQLNQDLLDRELKHKRFDIPGFPDEVKEIIKTSPPKIKIVTRTRIKKVKVFDD